MEKKAAKRGRRPKVAQPCFVIRGLHGNSDVRLPLHDKALVFVGPNGLGKSTIISCFYLFITCQWSRLSNYYFDSIEYTSSDGRIFSVSRSQISQHGKGSRSSVFERIERRIAGTPDYDLFISHAPLSTSEARRLASAIGIHWSDIDRFRENYRRIYSDDGDQAIFIQMDAVLREDFPGQILFLPTYRRIEQDFRALFPRLLEQMQRYGEQAFDFDRKTERYHEIIQFGMEDIQSLWSDTSASIQGYAKAQLSSLMSNYLRDVIRGAAGGVDPAFFRDVEDSDIQKVLSRVEENALDLKDQDVLRSTVQSLRDQENPTTDALYLGYFFQRLSSVVSAIEQRESRVRDLVATLNGYFLPAKRVHYDAVSYGVSITNDAGQEIELSSLSSGEKQIVSLFSILFLGDSARHWIIIDEPELSLSVPWQEKFLDDVYKNAKCEKLIAVTHSPFVYKNNLRPFAKDIVKFVEKRIDH